MDCKYAVLSATAPRRRPGARDDRPHHAPVPRRPCRQLPAPASTCSTPASRSPRRDQRRAAARGRGPGDHRDRAVPAGRGAADRSPTASSAAPTSTSTSSSSSAASRPTSRSPSSPDGSEELAPPVIRVIDKVRHVKDIQRADFEYLKSPGGAPGMTPKVTIPSPTMLHFRGGRAGISREAYPELDPLFYDDVAQGLRRRVEVALSDAGCRYVQMDDTNMAYLCDEKMREAARSARRRPQRAAAPLRQVHQQGGGAQAGGHDAGDAPVPRQLQEHPRGGRQLRAGGRGAAGRDEPRRLSSWSTTTSARATSARCASCPRARSSCSGW